MPSFRELLAQTKAEITRGRHRRGATSAARAAARSSSTCASPTSTSRARSPAPSTSPGATSRAQIENRVPDKDTPLIVHCAGGVRSAFAAKTLAELGYTDVASMAGGFNKWKDEGREWKVPAVLGPTQRNRYQRHLLLPEVGVEGQLKLLDAKVLLLGAGGLGSPAALYLAAAGVGTIGIIDMDVVDESNLQRQILHNLDRIGERKVDSAKKTLTSLNPDVERRDLRRPPRRRQRHGDPRRLRRRRRRRRQLPVPLPAQRRLGEARHPRRARLDLPLRGPGHGVRPPQRPHLPRPAARAAAGRVRPVLRRGRRARRAARHHRLAAGARGDQADPRPRRRRCGAASWPSTPSRWPSASTSCGSTPTTRSPGRTATASRSSSSRASACPT